MSELRQTFKVTHPFHPRYGNTYELFNYHRSWGYEYIESIDEKGQASAIPLLWTDAAGIDPLVELSQGRCAFRITDLLRLCDLIDDLDS
ncbi:MAG: hypothetical protein GY938_04190 [Ketobacter sp.]|nr:hypothetical protein [Ketobacter sp.]